MKRIVLFWLAGLTFSGCGTNYSPFMKEIGISLDVTGPVSEIRCETVAPAIKTDFLTVPTERQSRTVFLFNESGQIREIRNDSEKHRTEIHYNDKGVLQNIRLYLDKEVISDTSFQIKGQTIQAITIRSDNRREEKHFTLDRQGNITTFLFLAGSDIINRYEAEFEGRILTRKKEWTLLSNGSRYVQETLSRKEDDNRYLYLESSANDPKGVISESAPIRRITFLESGYPESLEWLDPSSTEEIRVRSRTVYQYDATGNLLEEREYNIPTPRDSSPQLVSGKDYEYTFDSQGNWIERKIFYCYFLREEPQRVLLETTTRQISYRE